MNKTIATAAAAFIALAGAAPAMAQKSKDTLRFPVSDMEAGIDQYLLPGTFHYGWAPSVYDNLLGFNPAKGEFVGQLAKSWTQPDPTTYDYELRTDVKWHDGQALTADDVVYTISYLIDPKVNLRYKAYWQWIRSVEKLGPNKVRVTSKTPVPDGLMWMVGSTPIYPKHVHEPLANKGDFGSKPVGTGPFQITKFDKNTGIVAERYKNYVSTPAKAAAPIGRILAEPINDSGTIVAAMLTDKADVAANLPADQAASLQQTGRFEVTLSPPALAYTFIGFPTKGADNVKALGDIRVRQAIIKAIDRTQVLAAWYGDLAKGLSVSEALCSKEQLGCAYTKLTPDYDPAGARKLLAEASYPDGFDVTISTFPLNNVETTAVAGMLRAVGIKASVRQHPIAQRVQLLSQGKVDIGYYGWSGGAVFEVSSQLARHFTSGEYDDPVLTQMATETFTMMDDAARRKAVAKVLEYATDHAYVFPMIPSRPVITHTKEVRIIDQNAIRASQVIPIHEFGWK